MNGDTWFTLYSQALSQDDALLNLRELVRDLLAQGYDRQDIIRSLNNYSDVLRSLDEEEKNDTVSEVLDALTGWVLPKFRL